MDLCKVNLCIRTSFIQFNTGSCCAHITGGVNIYSNVLLNVLPGLCVYVSVFVRYQLTTLAKPRDLCQSFSIFDTFLHKTDSKMLPGGAVV